MTTPRWSPLFSSFWTLQGIGWGTYGVLWYLASLPIYDGIDASVYVGGVRVLYYVGLGAGVTLALRPLYRRLWGRGGSLATLLTISLACSLLGSAVWLALFEGVKWPLDSAPFSGAYGAGSLWYFARPVLSNTIVLLAWSALYFGIKDQRHLLAQQERTLRAETLAREAQIQMLRYQLNPHFLFNTLNTLVSLIGEDDRRAKQFVHELAEFLRYSLLDTDTHTVSLHEEIEVIHSFLAIEKLRFEDDLQVEFDVDPATESMQIPPFLVQSLVENAVKHGRATSPIPLRVRLSTIQAESTLRIRVENTGRLAPASARNGHGGIGLKNAQERLQRLYPDRHRFTLRAEEGWVRAEVVIQRSDAGEEGEGRLETPRVAGSS
jgi:signal transduction histidine kinase